MEQNGYIMIDGGGLDIYVEKEHNSIFDDDWYSDENMLEHLHQENIQSIIVEGGISTLNQFIDNQLWDEARIIKSSISWKD